MRTLELSRWTKMVAVGVMAMGLAGCSKGGAPQMASPPAADESITNTQEQGVDEGGIVKAHGDHLVVLRRGRLFTVNVGDDQLRPVSWVDVTPHPGHRGWYDEMIVHGDTVVVVGYSYGVRASEIGLFHIDDRGGLTYQDSYFLGSGDYYSASNYATRLVGDTLVMYMPIWAWDDDEPGLALAPWRGGDRRTRKHGDWDRLMTSASILPPLSEDRRNVVHTIVTCDLSQAALGCQARGIAGGEGRTFYVSSEAVYVWTRMYSESGEDDAAGDRAELYRLPLGGGPIGAVVVNGMPVDQFSFKEAADGDLQVFVRNWDDDEPMWGVDRSAGHVSLLTVPAAMLRRRGGTAPSTAYRELPSHTKDQWDLHARFVGDVLLYGEASGWHEEEDTKTSVFAHRYADAQPHTDEITLPHAVDRIEALGRDGLVVGRAGDDLHLTALQLGSAAAVASRFVLPRTAQGEWRSHGFFFKPSGRGDGTLGLPVRGSGASGFASLFESSAAIMFFDVDDLRLDSLGALA
ncbi:MAG: beta-propeller domain-containing protein, partial [Deltaproteobacteria bacterium]|nr:beta-propeller domain-containing protein [Deltaproteobacteria bacterium]